MTMRVALLPLNITDDISKTASSNGVVVPALRRARTRSRGRSRCRRPSSAPRPRRAAAARATACGSTCARNTCARARERGGRPGGGGGARDRNHHTSVRDGRRARPRFIARVEREGAERGRCRRDHSGHTPACEPRQPQTRGTGEAATTPRAHLRVASLTRTPCAAPLSSPLENLLTQLAIARHTVPHVRALAGHLAQLSHARTHLRVVWHSRTVSYHVTPHHTHARESSSAALTPCHTVPYHITRAHLRVVWRSSQ